MKKLLLLSCGLFAIVIFTLTTSVPSAYSDELDDINRKLSELQQALEASKKATTPLESQIASMKKQIAGIENQIAFIENDIVRKKKDIEEGYKDFEKQRDLFSRASREYYMQNASFPPILIFLSSASASELIQAITFQKQKADINKAIITNTAIKIADLEQRKKTLESEEKRLSSVKTRLAAERQKIEEVVAGAKNYQASVSSQIAELSAKQKQIMSARSGNFTISIGSGELADEYLSSLKGFQDTAPSGYFAIFSIGAYTHRNGMSQYGALGRVQQGQSAEQILKHYYPGVEITKVDTNQTITVNGTNTYGQNFNNVSYQLEDYLKHIYEMPGSWPLEVLKVQAIAARSYAYGKSTVCPNQDCQEVKLEENTDTWKQAVKETEGMIMTGGINNRQYSAITGGWLNTSGWDTTDGQRGENFMDKTYEKTAGSPWGYKAWWRNGTSKYGDTCGRTNPWLSPEEMADIANAAIALKVGGIDTSRIAPVTTSCWPEKNPYSMEELRNLVSTHGGISSATSVKIEQGNNTTNRVIINNISMTGLEFKRAVCLRAPGYIRIPQSTCEGGWAFFNIEHK